VGMLVLTREGATSEVDQWKAELGPYSEEVVTAGAGVTSGSSVKPNGDGVGSAGNPSGTVAVGVGAGDSVGCVLVTVAKTLASSWSAATWLSLTLRERGEAGDACWRLESCGEDSIVGGGRDGHGDLSWEPHECVSDSFS
jgi:hypothetical protein